MVDSHHSHADDQHGSSLAVTPSVIDESVERIIPRSHAPHLTTARHILCAFACVALCNPGSPHIPANIRRSLDRDRGIDPVTVAIDWFGHALQFAHASKTKNGKDPISGVLEACYEELQSLHAKKTLGQRAMRHISSILSYSDEPTRSAAISALASLTEIEKDKLNEARLESLDHYLDELQRRAEEARQSHDYYEGVDDLTPAVDAASQYDIREIDEDLRIGALASALATPKARA